MKTLLFITTSNGVHILDDATGKSRCILGNKHTPGFFKKRAYGYFGITFHKKSGKVIVASREKLGTTRHKKPTTDVKLHAIDPSTLESEQIATILDAHDVHQITSDGDLIYIADTGKNRVLIYDITAGKTHRIINIGEVRDDINHINALKIIDGNLFIGLNNRGSESEILTLPVDVILDNDKFELDALQSGQREIIKNTFDSHDLEPFKGSFLCCSSQDGRVIDIQNSATLIKEKDWIRGIITDDKYLWLGISRFANRHKRHSKSLDGRIHKYSLDDFSLINSYTLSNSGQINDLINVTIG